MLEHPRTRPFKKKYRWDKLRPIIPYPYGTVLSRDAFPGTLCQATLNMSLRDRLQSVLSLREALPDISQQHLAKARREMSRRDSAIVAWHEVPGLIAEGFLVELGPCFLKAKYSI